MQVGGDVVLSWGAATDNEGIDHYSIDAGVAMDAGSVVDAGVVAADAGSASDAGVAVPGSFAVGCGCSEADGVAVFLAMFGLLALPRRIRRRSN
jgi:uncharacterized protein (TIGR03382 family)